MCLDSVHLTGFSYEMGDEKKSFSSEPNWTEGKEDEDEGKEENEGEGEEKKLNWIHEPSLEHSSYKK